MKIMEQWIIGCQHIVRLEDGTYRVGTTSNIYGYSEISEEKFLRKLNGVD